MLIVIAINNFPWTIREYSANVNDQIKSFPYTNIIGNLDSPFQSILLKLASRSRRPLERFLLNFSIFCVVAYFIWLKLSYTADTETFPANWCVEYV